MSNKKRPPIRGLNRQKTAQNRPIHRGGRLPRRGALPLAAALLCVATALGGPPPDEAAVSALQPAQGLVGEWRGVGQPKRGVSQGAWIESAAWEWEFEGEKPTLAMQVVDGKHWSAAKLTAPDQGSADFALEVTLPDGSQLDFTGQPDESGVWTFRSAKASAAQPSRITLKFVASGARMVVLLEGRANDRYFRIAEIGYTRRGATFAAGDGHPECIVTGGYGSIAVEHEGRTYYVCCTGCQELFESDPQRVIAEYQERQAAKKKAE